MDKKALKKWLEKARGYSIRQLKLRTDGNITLFLRKPTQLGNMTVTVTRKFLDIKKEGKK